MTDKVYFKAADVARRVRKLEAEHERYISAFGIWGNGARPGPKLAGRYMDEQAELDRLRLTKIGSRAWFDGDHGPWKVTEFRWPAIQRESLDDPDADESYGLESYDDGRRYASDSDARAESDLLNVEFPPGEEGWPYFAPQATGEVDETVRRRGLNPMGVLLVFVGLIGMMPLTLIGSLALRAWPGIPCPVTFFVVYALYLVWAYRNLRKASR